MVTAFARLSFCTAQLFHKQTPLFLSCRRRTTRSGPDVEFNILAAPETKTSISHIRPGGFVVDGYNVKGSVALFQGTFLKWNVSKVEDISEASLVLFRLLNPTPEILVLGTGDHLARIPPAIVQALRVHGIALEAQPSNKASATYNFLVQEGRLVAAALLPPTKV